MANETDSVPDVITNPTFVKAPDYKIVYTNLVRTGVGAFDIRITFGQMLETVPPTQTCQELVTVIMSPEEAKAVLHALTKAIQIYEKNYGEIKDLTPVLEEMRTKKLASAN